MVFERLNLDDIDPDAVYSYLKKNVSIADLIRQGDIVFLAGASYDPSNQKTVDILENLERSRNSIMRKLKRSTRKRKLDLVDFSRMDHRKLSAALRGYVFDEKLVAETIISEARYWVKSLKIK